MLRPGFIYDKVDRWWSIPLKFGVDLSWLINDKMCKILPPWKALDFFFPAKSVSLDTLRHFAEEGVFGRLGDSKIVRNEEMTRYDDEHHVK